MAPRMTTRGILNPKPHTHFTLLCLPLSHASNPPEQRRSQTFSLVLLASYASALLAFTSSEHEPHAVPRHSI
eukprot:1806581-Rhodomonas_salina.1